MFMSKLNSNQCECKFPTHCKLFRLDNTSKLLGICPKCRDNNKICSYSKIILVNSTTLIGFIDTIAFSLDLTEQNSSFNLGSSVLLSPINRLSSIEINLKYIKIQYEGCKQLISGLVQFQLLTTLKLYLQGNDIGAEGIACFSAGIVKLKQLENMTLNLKQNNINTQGVICLCLSLKTLTNLSFLSLTLQNNEIEEIGAEYLFRTISNLTLLTSLYLNLSQNRIEISEQMVYDLNQLNHLNSLSLDFQNCQLQEEHIFLLNEMINEQRQLKYLSLNISENYDLDELDFKPLFQDISILKQLTELKLNLKGMNIIQQDVFSLTKALSKLNQLTVFLLKLEYSGKELDLLCQQIGKMKNLTCLTINFECSDVNKFEYISKALSSLSNLISLTLTLKEENLFKNFNLVYGYYSSSQIAIFTSVLRNLQNLKYLSLDLNWGKLGDQGIIQMIYYIQYAYYVKYLKIEFDEYDLINKNLKKELKEQIKWRNRDQLYQKDYIFDSQDDFDDNEDKPFRQYTDLSSFGSGDFGDLIEMEQSVDIEEDEEDEECEDCEEYEEDEEDEESERSENKYFFLGNDFDRKRNQDFLRILNQSKNEEEDEENDDNSNESDAQNKRYQARQEYGIQEQSEDVDEEDGESDDNNNENQYSSKEESGLDVYKFLGEFFYIVFHRQKKRENPPIIINYQKIGKVQSSSPQYYYPLLEQPSAVLNYPSKTIVASNYLITSFSIFIMSFSTLASSNANNILYSTLNENQLQTSFIQGSSGFFNQMHLRSHNNSSNSSSSSNGNVSLSNLQNQPQDTQGQEIDEYQNQSNINDSQEGEENNSEMSDIMDERQFIRISTAPPRPLTDLEEFKRSYEFLLLEQAIVTSSKLILKDYQKFDLDSPEGQKIFRKFLSILERLIKAFDCNTSCRRYRDHFSKAYKILYRNGELCYLTEILDSAQEGFPYLYVNGEKYIFTSEVLDSGRILLDSFQKLQQIMRNAYTQTCQENINVSSFSIKREISSSLEKFDQCWARFEQLYVMELMSIETEARRYVQSAIEIEKELTSIEIREKIKGRFFIQSQDYANLRQKLCKYIAQMNAVANLEGRGRDDLEFEILCQAEGILRRYTNEQSKAVRSLAETIKKNFQDLRELFRKYEQNIEMVDPQLKNNNDLVVALQTYETSWEKGKNYFLDGKKCSYLIHLSYIIETTANKYPEFQEQLECRDAEIFLSIPCLLLLNLLDGQDKNICGYFLPQILDEKKQHYQTLSELKGDFSKWKILKKKNYIYFNTLERMILNIESTSSQQMTLKEEESNLCVGKILHKIKQLAMEMQRNNPMEWNSFLDAALYC